MFKCAKALHYAHSRGVIHRDIKPSNLMLTTDSDLRLIDFGIALHNDADFSRIEGIAGSPSYMSPEQVQSLELTNHSDIYSLGAVMYELLTGHRPFRAGALAKLLHQIVYATPPPMLSLRPDLPAGTRERRRDGDAQGARKALSERRGVRERDRARARAAAQGNRPERPPGAFQPAAAPQVLPRLLVGRDLGGPARGHLAGTRPGRRDRACRRHRRPLLRDRRPATATSSATA